MDVGVGVVSGSEVVANLDGSESGRVLQCAITHALDTQNVQTFQGGEEFNPPKGCAVVVVAAGESYKIAATVDDGVAPAMDIGGKRIYATDADGNAEVAEVRLHPDGTAEVFNGLAAFTLAPDGTVVASNGAASFTMSPAGVFTFHGAGSTFDHPVTIAGGLSVTGGHALHASGELNVDGALTTTGRLNLTGAAIDGRNYLLKNGAFEAATIR